MCESGDWVLPIYEKKQSSKISCYCPFKEIGKIIVKYRLKTSQLHLLDPDTYKSNTDPDPGGDLKRDLPGSRSETLECRCGTGTYRYRLASFKYSWKEPISFGTIVGYRVLRYRTYLLTLIPYSVFVGLFLIDFSRKVLAYAGGIENLQVIIAFFQ